MSFGTPYVTPAMLTSAPTGISWSIIPFPKATTPQQLAEQTNICWRATSIVDGYCNQVLRATVDNENISGPGNYRVTQQSATGNTRVILRRWPVTQILAVQVSPNSAFPRQFQLVPSGMYDVEHPVLGLYSNTAPTSSADGGQSMLIAPGFVSNALGRDGYRMLVSYTNGWPHTSLTASVTAGATVLNVDDVTAWAGASAFIYDGAVTETITVTSVTSNTPLVLPNNAGTALTGPGTLTLSAPLLNAHSAGAVVSTLPGSVIWAATLAATSQALEAGITSVSIQNIPGSLTTGGHGVSDIKTEYELLLEPYKRVI
jgi:hypothetical protein